MPENRSLAEHMASDTLRAPDIAVTDGRRRAFERTSITIDRKQPVIPTRRDAAAHRLECFSPVAVASLRP
jgi:hypothetical protein